MPKKWVGRGRRGLSLYRAGRPREGGQLVTIPYRKSLVSASKKKYIHVNGSYFTRPPPANTARMATILKRLVSGHPINLTFGDMYILLEGVIGTV
jgi:hypothetical protein